MVYSRIISPMDGNRAETIMAEHRSSHAPDGEPLVTDTRVVRDMKRGTDDPDLGINLAALFRDLNDIDEGDELTVEVFRDRYVIVPGNEVDE